MSGDSVLPRLPKPGDLVDGKYEIVGVIGRGGMGIVFEAIHQRIRQRVALKMLHPHVKEEPGVIDRFEREARAAGQLVSPNIARVLDVATSASGLPYIVMEFLEGRDLAEELDVEKQLPVAVAVGYVLQACAAMRDAHALGIIHRDLKPANLFLCPGVDGPVIKILDFGISKITTEVDGRLTAAMTTLGSPVYMSPEQLRGASEVDQRTDVWSLGVVLYELLAGQPPFAGTLTAVTAAIIADAPPSLATHRDDVPPELDAVVATALQKYPANRFPDAESFARALVPFASAESARALSSRLSIPPAPPSTPRLTKLRASGRDDATVLASPTVAGAETRHSFSTGAFERAARPSSASRVLIIGCALAGAGALALAAALTLRAPVAPPAAASGSAVPADAPAVTPPAPSAAPTSPPPPAPSAAAQPSAAQAGTTTPSLGAPAPSRAPLPRAAPRPNPPAPGNNPLRL